MSHSSATTARCARLFIALCLFGATATNFIAQTPETKQQPTGGNATGEARVYTSKRTIGIVDPKAPVVFEDVTARTALANFRHHAGTQAKDYILEAPSGGVAIFDYDGDGRPDIYLLNGSTFAALQGKEKAPRAALYHNLGNWKFEDVTDKAGVANERWGFGVAVGDYDNDGRPDIFVSNFGTSRLYHNNGDGTFTDVAEKLGVARKGWSTGASWGDYDGDDRLDLIVVNDSTPKQLYINKGDGTFEEVGYESGVALNENGREQAGMGLAIGDYDNDGRVDFYITNFSDDSNTLYHNDGEGNFTDVTFQAGHGEVTIPFLGWGTSFLDYDNDGWKDVLVVNGHAYPSVDEHPCGTSWAEQPLLF